MKILRALSAMPVTALVVLALAGCADTQASLQEARTKVAATLPAPYFEDLVTESVAIEGDRLVLLIRSPKGSAARTREAPGFDTLKESEQIALRELCTQPAIMPLTDTDAVLVRRFVDRHDAVFFDVELPARACATPPTDAPAQP
ncbi:hypothetical protein FB548_3621 [Pseudoxanthomonas sp. 3HH-4]|uniref:hypothetical protein n=1 Tax=Pseudoxanthomonas sp. 3HH-4 TaxID=1690214 RepID=UPI00114DB9FF|nr:hypothetical protein [Pseudoxanthomonas sp. 3HH-4]TQM03662.1 hypothetical protein FB548_3621 [Pseudoxanthomonas sp. 3HH-4]